MQDCPELKEKLDDAEISRIKREGIDAADACKEHGCSQIFDEAHDRQKTSTRKSFYFVRPW